METEMLLDLGRSFVILYQRGLKPRHIMVDKALSWPQVAAVAAVSGLSKEF